MRIQHDRQHSWDLKVRVQNAWTAITRPRLLACEVARQGARYLTVFFACSVHLRIHTLDNQCSTQWLSNQTQLSFELHAKFMQPPKPRFVVTTICLGFRAPTDKSENFSANGDRRTGGFDLHGPFKQPRLIIVGLNWYLLPTSHPLLVGGSEGVIM